MTKIVTLLFNFDDSKFLKDRDNSNYHFGGDSSNVSLGMPQKCDRKGQVRNIEENTSFRYLQMIQKFY